MWFASSSALASYAKLPAHVAHVQVCGVFALFLSGAHNFIWWGLYCYPRLRVTAVTAYFITAGACVLLGLTARSNAKRATPMLVLLLLRFVVVLARLILNSGSCWASIHFLWMEVRTVGKLQLALRMWWLCTSFQTICKSKILVCWQMILFLDYIVCTWQAVLPVCIITLCHGRSCKSHSIYYAARQRAWHTKHPVRLMMCTINSLFTMSNGHDFGIHSLWPTLGASEQQCVHMQVLTCTGAVVNVMRIPEKWYHNKDPRIAGKFDYWLNSHQIMHILVAGAMIHYSLGAACDYLHFMKQTQCPAWELM